MKEIDLFSKWADSVVESKWRGLAPMLPAGDYPDSIPSVKEDEHPTRMGTQMSAQADRPLPRQLDIAYKAQKAHPELSPEQALALYMSDELEKSEKIDAKQDREIDSIDHEVDHVEHDEQELQNQLSRLIQLVKNTH